MYCFTVKIFFVNSFSISKIDPIFLYNPSKDWQLEQNVHLFDEFFEILITLF